MEGRNAERVGLRAERDKLRAADPKGLAGAWAIIEEIWIGTVARAKELPESMLHERVEGGWSFVETHRHLVLVTDCWLRRMVNGSAHVILKEEWQHHRYAVRDLAVLERRPR